MEALRGDKGARLAEETLGCGGEAETSLGDALWCCSNLYSDIKLRLSHKRLMLFTCRDQPHAGDSARDRQARTKAGDLKETGKGTSGLGGRPRHGHHGVNSGRFCMRSRITSFSVSAG